jgi:uncharacterized protein YkwD
MPAVPSIRRSAGILSMLVAALLTFGVLAPHRAQAATSSENLMRQLINQERTERGKVALTMNSLLVELARKQSNRMANDGKLYHSPNLAQAMPGSWDTWGENVGMGSSVKSLHALFMDSKPHRKNILNGSFDRVGVGIEVRDGVTWVTVIFAGS